MGTYTTNYNLFMPSVGEQGWGTLVNTNFSTIDSTMKSLSNSIGTLETETDAMKEKVDAIELNNDGSVTVGSATQLNKTITVSPSSDAYLSNSYTFFNYCPYVPGVLYYGSVEVKPNASGTPQGVVYIQNNDDTITKTEIANSVSWQEFSFSSAKCICLLIRQKATYIHMPLFL